MFGLIAESSAVVDSYSLEPPSRAFSPELTRNTTVVRPRGGRPGDLGGGRHPV